MKENTRIILVRPSHPGNIGAVARAMKTMGFAELYVVAPRCSLKDAAAVALATHAADILRAAVVVPDVKSALENITFVYATTANARAVSLPIFSARTAAENVAAALQVNQQTAIIFGPENHGLATHELNFAHALLQIPTAEDYHSLNLAAAVQIVCYELALAQKGIILQENTSRDIPASPASPASMDKLISFYDHLAQVLIHIEALDPAAPGQMMPRLQRLFNRAQPDAVELNILRGILRQIERKFVRI